MRFASRRVLLVSCATVAFVAALAHPSRAEEKHAYSIGQQDLGAALRQFSQVSGTDLIFPPELVRGRVSPPISGTYPDEVVLKALLAGTGLTAVKTASGAMVVRVAPSKISAETPPAKSIVVAQASPPPVQTAQAPAAGVEEIIVTGSRVERNGYEAPTPTTVIGVEQIQTAAPVNLADFVNQLPQLGAPTSPATASNGVSGGTGGANFLNLRGLGAARSLVLLDGRRVVASATNGSVDINLLPTALIQRVDVVTGGASASWGSDAVGGVVNFILDKNFTGVKGEVQAGISGYGDGENGKVSLSFGSALSGGRGHVLVSAEYSNSASVDNVANRPWFKGYKGIVNPNFVLGGTQPGYLLLPQVGLANMTDGGLISAGPLKGIQFGPGGQVLPFTFGSIVRNPLQYGGTYFDFGVRNEIQAGVEQQKAFTRFTYDLNDTFTAYAEGSYGLAIAKYVSVPYFRQGDITVKSDNPFIPTALLSQMAALKVTSFTMGRTNWDLDPVLPVNTRKQYRAVVGTDADFDTFGKWHAYYQYGESKAHNTIPNTPVIARYNFAVDVVANPAVGGVAGVAAGTPVCRSTLTSPTNGCVPMNIFGYGSPSQESRKYVMGMPEQFITLQQNVFAASGQLEPFSTWAGPVSLAIGAEFRTERYKGTTDPLDLTAASPYWVGNYKPGAGHYQVNEQFAEAVVPLISEKPFAKQVDLQAAFRSTDYSTSGRVGTWKLGLTYDVNGELRFRGTRSRDIRAPNLGELFAGGTTGAQNISDLLSPAATPPQVQGFVFAGGNPLLHPEIADNTGIGFVYQPEWFNQFSVSVDYWNIELKDAIATLGAAFILNGCYGYGVPRDASLCQYIKAVSPTTLAGATISNVGINQQSQTAAGIDIEASYRLALADINNAWDGNLTFHATASNSRIARSVLGGTLTDNNGANIRKWRGTGTISYAVGASTTSVTMRYIGPGVYNNLPLGDPNSVDINHIESATYFDVSQSYNLDVLGSSSQVYVAIQNLLDKDPPVVAQIGGNSYAGNGVSGNFYDLLGRTFRMGLRFKY